MSASYPTESVLFYATANLRLGMSEVTYMLWRWSRQGPHLPRTPEISRSQRTSLIQTTGGAYGDSRKLSLWRRTVPDRRKVQRYWAMPLLEVPEGVRDRLECGITNGCEEPNLGA